MIILTPSSPLPQAEALHLLPFRLAPLPVRAPIKHYFHGTFRGRALVPQRIDVPDGYEGVVLRASGGPNSNSNSNSNPGHMPLTPAPSTASASSRARGAGQVALSRPRRAARARVRRVAMDDDDEEEEEEQRLAKRTRAALRHASAPREGTVDATMETPVETAMETPVEKEAQTAEIDAPQIETGAKLETEEQAQTPLTESCTETPTQTESQTAPDDLTSTVPGITTIDAPSTASVSEPEPAAALRFAADGTPARVLAPVARFEAFTLWTPDAGIAGFVQDELERRGLESEEGQAEDKADGEVKKETDPREDNDAKEAPAPVTAPTTSLQRGWWRQGGAGEGGDEFVRALGEWLGLGEIIHAPCYPLEDDE